MDNSGYNTDLEQNTTMVQNGKSTDGRRKKVLVVGAGAAGMSTAYHLSNHPDKFDVTIIEKESYCGGQAFSVSLDKDRHGASWFNQGVQGGSHIFHHTVTMFARQGYHADPVNLHVSFGKDETFWSNVFPTQLMVKHAKEVRRLTILLKFMRWFEVFFALLPLRLVFKMFLFSEDFINTIALPMTALFLGTGNATPETPAMMFERLCTSPTYGMWYPPDKYSVATSMPPMIVFPNFTDFYTAWQKDLESRGVKVRLTTKVVNIVNRSKSGPVVVQLQSLTSDSSEVDGPVTEETYDELVMCTLADAAKSILGKTASWKEKKILGSAKFSDDITITHTDSDYMKKHYENFYRSDLAADVSKKPFSTSKPSASSVSASITGTDPNTTWSDRLEYGSKNFRPMYYIKMYPQDLSKLEMCFDTTNYQSQFPENVPFEDHVFQTIFLNKDRDGHLWSDKEIDPDKIIKADWWHQLCHSFTHYLLLVPWMMFIQAKKHTRFAGSWTLVNAHEIAVMSGIAAAVDLGATYPEDLEHDKFAFLCFRLYYLIAYGKWYKRKFQGSTSEKAKQGQSWAQGLYGSRYTGPGVTEEERRTWKEEMKLGRSTNNLASGNGEGRSQP